VGRVSAGTFVRVLTAAVVAATALGTAAAWPAGRTAPTRVTIFGDSAAEVLDYVPDAKSYLGSGLDVNWQLKVCRRLVQLSCPYQGVRPPTVNDVVQATANGGLGPTVVVDVGYNDYVDQYQNDMETVIKAMLAKGVQHIIWTTLHEVRTDYKSMNATIRAEAAKWPQITIADWNAASQGQPWFNDDGIHLNSAGAWGLARLLRPAILAACGNPCQPPPVGTLPRSYVINVGPSGIRIGPFLLWKPPLRGTYAQATAAFGRAGSCRALPGKKSQATWPAIGLTIQFVGVHGSPCQTASSMQLQTLTATGLHWRTSRGLGIGDPLTKLQELYPGAVAHPKTYWLVKLDQGANHALFSAAIRGGHVAAFALVLRLGS
jgi:hypothetical protein